MNSAFSVKDMILAELRKSGNAREVRKSCKSMSLFSECLNVYIDERLAELERINQEKSDVEASVVHLLEDERGLEESVELLSAKKKRLVSNDQRLSKDVQQKASQVEVYDSKINFFGDKGITLEMLEKISVVERGSGYKLLDQLLGLENRNELVKECDGLEKRKAGLNRMVKKVEKKIGRLDDSIEAKEDLLEAVNYDVDVAKAKLDVIENRVIESIEKTRDSGIAAIDSTAEDARQQRKHVFVEEKKNIEIVGEKACENIRIVEKVAENGTRRLTGIVEGTAENVESRFLGLAESFREGLGEWSELQKKIGELGENVRYGRAFFNLTSDFEVLRQIPPLGVANILDRCVLWNRFNYPGLKVQPTGIYTQSEAGLNSFWAYKTEVLLMLVSNGFRKIDDGTI